jgi:hypothetical protein
VADGAVWEYDGGVEVWAAGGILLVMGRIGPLAGRRRRLQMNVIAQATAMTAAVPELITHPATCQSLAVLRPLQLQTWPELAAGGGGGGKGSREAMAKGFWRRSGGRKGTVKGSTYTDAMGGRSAPTAWRLPGLPCRSTEEIPIFIQKSVSIDGAKLARRCVLPTCQRDFYLCFEVI